LIRLSVLARFQWGEKSAVYAKQDMSQDARGFVRYLGKDPSGKQQKFRLGNDESKASLAKAKLETLWKRLNQEQWDEPALSIAKAIARGENTTSVPPTEPPDPMGYLNWIYQLNRKYGDLITILPEQPDLWQKGVDRQESVQRRLQDFRQRALQRYTLLTADAEIVGTFYEALDGYIAQLELEQFDYSGWKRTKVNEARILKAHLPDIPLAKLNLDAMEAQLTILAKRPMVRNKNKRMSRLSSRNLMKRLRDFWKWLHRTDKFAWRRPEEHDELKVRIADIPSDNLAILKTIHVETYTVEELTILYQHATPLVRAFLLLGLNCGFSIAEVSSLAREEVFLRQKHPHYSLLGSWILRVRAKTKVYGEFKLWDGTVSALEWAMKTLSKPDKPNVFLTAQGNVFNARTRSGNKPSRIPNLWKNLYRTVCKQHPTFRFLPFKQLRKTAGEMIKTVSDGEIAGVFHARGKPVKTDVLSDVYTNRPFRKVFQAIDEVGKQLEPMFQSTANPFPE
jgi:hypothetical protein